MATMNANQGDRHPRPGDTFAGFLTGEREHDLRNVEILLDTIAEVNRTRDLDTLLVSVVDKTLEFTMAERGILLLADAAGVLRIHVARDSDRKNLDPDPLYSKTVPKKVLTEGAAVCMTATASENPIPVTQSVQHLGLLTVMGAPLWVKDRIIGVLYVDSSIRRRRFTKGDFGLFKALSYQLAIAIENARLVRKEQGLALAHDLQRRLMPAPRLPLPGYDIYSQALTCDETGGDFFDYLRDRDGHVGLVVGDVSGHGIVAALLMATGRALLRAFASMDDDLARIVTRLNRALTRDMGSDQFMTLFYGDLDLADRTLTWVKAGHCEPILYRGSTREVQMLGGRGMGLGFEQDYEYTAVGPMKLHPGDALLIYTDGITEARNPAGEFFGTERLIDIVSGSHESSQALVERIVSEVTEFSGGEGYADDLTLIAARLLDV